MHADLPAYIELFVAADEKRAVGNKAFQEGSLSEAVKNYYAALVHNDKAVEADPENPVVLKQARKIKAAVLGNLAACHLKNGALDKAAEAASQSLAEEPSNTKLLYRRAVAYRRMGRLDMAHADLCTALEVDPSSVAIQQEMKEVQAMKNAKTPRAKKKNMYANMLKGIQGIGEDRIGNNIDAETGQGPFYSAGSTERCDSDEHPATQHKVLAWLKQEVAALQEACPLRLLSIDEPQPVAFVNASTANRELIPNPEGGWYGPWLIELRIKGPSYIEELAAKLPDPGAYGSVFRVQLCFSSAYPQVPPRIRFRSVIRHAFIKDSSDEDRRWTETLRNERRVGPAFFNELARRLQKPDNPLEFNLLDVCMLLCEMLEWAHPDHVPPAANVEQWHLLRKEHCGRLQTIREYPKFMKHPAVFNALAGWRKEWFDADLAHVLFSQPPGSERDKSLRDLMTEEMKGVYSFQLFSLSFCELFLDELDNFMKTWADMFSERFEVDFPGKFLNTIGWEPMADLLLRDVLQPIAALLFPREGAQLDSIHPFINRYKPDLNTGLDMHKDNSDISFTGCLGRSFEGGALNFCGVMGYPNHRKLLLRYHHKVGRCVCHLGHHRHGVDGTTAGEKVSLVMWCQNIALRSDREHEDRIINMRGFQREDGAPDQECLSWTHDLDFGNFKAYPKGSEAYRKNQWYPTPEAAYPGFRPDRDLGK